MPHTDTTDIQEFIKGCSRAGGTLKTANKGERMIISEPNTQAWESEIKTRADTIKHELKNVIVCEGIDPANEKNIAAVPNPHQKGDILKAEIQTPNSRERINKPRIDGSNSSDDITIHSQDKTIGFRNGEKEETKSMLTEIDHEVSADIMDMENGQQASQKMRQQTEKALAQMDEEFEEEKKTKEFLDRRAEYELDRRGRGGII